MIRETSREGRRKAFLAYAEEMFEALEAWYDAHPEASFGEIEVQARQLRREMMGKVLGVVINGRDTGRQVEAPRCSRCGRKMRFVGYREWHISGLEGDTRLERAYYVCPSKDGETFFPPG